MKSLLEDDAAPVASAPVGPVSHHQLSVRLTQLSTVVVLVLAWQYLPKVDFLAERFRIFDPFFVSSPSDVVKRTADLLTGAHDTDTVWKYIWPTVEASVIGTVMGLVIGAALGLLFSNSAFINSTFRPFVVAINATPRIALIPIIVLLFGPTVTASVVIAFLVVVFVAFFSAFEGGASVPQHMVDNVQLLGGSRWQVLSRLRLPYVVAWTIATLPLSITFAIISVVTAEILTGITGMGKLLQTATTTAESALTFSVVIILAVVGVLSVVVADQIRARLLHWWGK